MSDIMMLFSCPICRGNDSETVFQALDFDQSTERFDLLRCTDCGLTQTSPQPGPEQIGSYYSQSYYGGGASKFSGPVEALTQFGNRYRAKKILKALTGNGDRSSKVRVLDIGCGRAALLACFRKLGCDCYGLERDEFPKGADLEGIDIHTGSLDDRPYADSCFDVVVIWHVLEHLHDPVETLEKLAPLMRPGAMIAVAVPNISSLQSKLFRSNWFHLDLPRHLFHFDSRNLGRALEQNGWTIEYSGTFSLEQNVFGFVQSVMNSLRMIGKPNVFYELLKQRSGLVQHLKLALWGLLALLILPFALVELVFSALNRSGASTIIFARTSGEDIKKKV
jgi:SAM-dependent methyltransferase